jgi:uncharacterized membrane protein YoaK (UPF0700 family)
MSALPTAPAAPPRAPSDVMLQSFELSFIAAFVDTGVFVGLFGLFTAHVTGNFVLIGSELVRHQGTLLAKFLSLPVFMLAIAAAVLMTQAIKRRSGNALCWLLGTEAAWLCITVFAAATMPAPTDGNDLSTLCIGMAAVVAMGIQNATMRLALPALPPTTVMTGNVTQVVIDAMALLADRGDAEASARLHKMLPPIAGFLLGATGGAFGYYVASFVSLVVPAGLCVVTAMRAGRSQVHKGEARTT